MWNHPKFKRMEKGGGFFCWAGDDFSKQKKRFFRVSIVCTKKHFWLQTSFDNEKVLLKCCQNRKTFQFTDLIFFRLSDKFGFRAQSANFLRCYFVIETRFPLNLRTLNWNIFRFRQHFGRTFSLGKLVCIEKCFFVQTMPALKKRFFWLEKSSPAQQKKPPPISMRLNFGEFLIYSQNGNTWKSVPNRKFFSRVESSNTQVSSLKRGAH